MIMKHEAIYRCEPELYLQQYFDEAGRVKREVEGSGTVSFRVLESNKGDDVWSHVAEAITRLDAPGAVRKVMGETSRMEEHASWRQGTNVIEMEYVPDKMTKKMSIKGTIRAEAVGDGTCRVLVEVDVTVKIFAVGGLIEKMAAKQMPKQFEMDAKYFNEHLAPK